jgi:predicted AlkP superfamily phosphohydrolase/phosphomutase
MESKKLRAAVIGLDGATFQVIKPLIEQGRLPVIAKLLENGSHGVLRSIIPPMTGPAWSVLATGRNPGKLGIFDFINRRQPDDYSLFPIRSQDLAGKAFWDQLNAAGYRVGVFNYPMLVPAYEIDGWMVAGLGASKLQAYTYPPELKQKLEQVTGGYEINISYGLPKYRDNWDKLVQDMRDSLRKRLAAIEHLLETDPVDVLMAVFIVSDVASHTLWRYWISDDGDSGSSLAQSLREEYISLWEELDAAVGRVLKYLHPEGHALIISDHGFGTSHGVFHVNYWLKQHGYLSQKAASAGGGNRLREWLVDTAKPLLNPLFRALEGSKAHQVLRASLLREIDLDDTQAFALENSDGYGGIYINRAYARQRGIDEAEFVEQTSHKLKEELSAWEDEPDVRLEVYRSEEIYSGARANLAPEVILIVNEGEASVSYRIEPPVYANRPHHPMKSGTHRMDGIFIADGPWVSGAPVEGAGLQDLAPTLLYMLETPPDPDMDGRVLVEMFKPEFRHQDQEPAGVTAAAPHAGAVEEEDVSEMMQRLKDLGYLD